jgi:hypothetical protein
MSTYYRFEEPIPYEKVLKELPEGVTFVKATKKELKDGMLDCLTDGENFLAIKASKGGEDTELSRFGGNDVRGIIEALMEKFEVTILSEHDEGFFDDEEDE